MNENLSYITLDFDTEVKQANESNNIPGQQLA